MVKHMCKSLSPQFLGIQKCLHCFWIPDEQKPNSLSSLRAISFSLILPSPPRHLWPISTTFSKNDNEKYFLYSKCSKLVFLCSCGFDMCLFTGVSCKHTATPSFFLQTSVFACVVPASLFYWAKPYSVWFRVR